MRALIVGAFAASLVLLTGPVTLAQEPATTIMTIATHIAGWDITTTARRLKCGPNITRRSTPIAGSDITITAPSRLM